MNAPWDMVVTVIVAVLGSSGLWSFIEHKTGRLAELETQIQALDSKLDAAKQREDSRHADELRHEIIRFDAEMKRHTEHTYKEFEDIVRYIGEYDELCKEMGKTYQNHTIAAPEKSIKDAFETLRETREFL